MVGSHRGAVGDRTRALAADIPRCSHVSANTPPTFLFHTRDDDTVPVQNALVFYTACIEHGVRAAELHVYQHGPHGVALAEEFPVLATWTERLADWLQFNGLLS